MPYSNNSYQNWNEFFKGNFEGSKKYTTAEEKENGDSLIVKFVPVDQNDLTIITVCYLEDKLLFWKFENPKTRGFNKQQEVEYFYRYDFTEGKTYGNPGLEFIENNISVMQKELRQGLRGKEIQFFKNGEHLKSEISHFYFNNKESYPQTIYFKNRNIWQKIFSLFLKDKNEEFQIKEIDLNEIFGGI